MALIKPFSFILYGTIAITEYISISVFFIQGGEGKGIIAEFL